MTTVPVHNVSPTIADLLKFLEQVPSESNSQAGREQHPPFFLSQVSDQAGVIYEKLRSAVDNKEEHFLRRHAIRRIARRAMWFSEDPESITTLLLRELYRCGYLPANSVSREAEDRVMKTVKGFLLLSASVGAHVDMAEFLRLRSTLLDIVAGAIEDDLYHTYNEEVLVRTLARVTALSLDAPRYDGLSPDTKQTFIYLAAWRALFGADNALLVYKLWLLRYPQWKEMSEGDKDGLGKAFVPFVTESSVLLGHSFAKRLVPRMHNNAVAMTVIYDLVKRYGFGVGATMNNRDEFRARIREVIMAIYRSDIARASRRAWRAVLYIFTTKVLLALITESLFLSFWHGTLNYIAIGVNIIFHPLLLLLLTSWIVAPPKKNTERLITIIDTIVYGGELPATSVQPASSGIMNDVALAAYIVTLSAMLVNLAWWLDEFGFHVIDIVFFIAFLALVLYFGFRVRHAARRMELQGGREGFFQSLIELAALPFVSVGRWLVTKFEKLNIIAIFLDFFVEVPLKLIFHFFDSFSNVLHEKKEEMYS
ncbi:MAG: hypothetical protein AAB869_03050 [Patescibacteria group bacterium]